MIFGKKKDDAVKPEKIKHISQVPLLMDIKPREKYVFYSDYFKIDNSYATIMSFFHTDGAIDGFAAFWGVNRIPYDLPQGVSAINFEQVSRMTDNWISEHQTKAEHASEMDANAQLQTGTNTTRQTAEKSLGDLAVIAQELNNGASYLNVQNRILVKAPTLEKLDIAVDKIGRIYLDNFSTLRAAPYIGEQRQEISNLFAKNQKKRGQGFYYTSTEYAGSYSLVTQGMEDAAGEFVGRMSGDVNTSAVLFDADKFDHHVVIGSDQVEKRETRIAACDMWGSKIAQSALLDNHKVVHIILNEADMKQLGPEFRSLTYTIDMNKGDMNMFEMFGDVKDELSIFASQLQKLVLMAEQAYETNEHDRAIIRSSLESIATEFYVEQNMWRENAKAHRDQLRVVGVPHNEVPKLDVFTAYLDVAYTAMANNAVRDDEKLHALSVLRATFKNLLSANGDLFNVVTSDKVDGVRDGKRVIYNFSDLMRRGKGVAMAQLVNVIGFAVGNLHDGDVVIFHGAERIDEGIRDYVNDQLATLFFHGGRVVYIYNDIDKLLSDRSFNNFDKADYTILGSMSPNAVEEYEKLLGLALPSDLKKALVVKGPRQTYLRRGFDNVVFERELQLFPIQVKKRKRRAVK